ncbi:hypothetical protein ACOSQ4_026997 [Xanthoceras sorbifolium]
MLTGRICHFHRELVIAICGRDDWSRYSLPQIILFIASCSSRSLVIEVPREIKIKKSRNCRTRVRNHIFPAYILVVLL